MKQDAIAFAMYSSDNNNMTVLTYFPGSNAVNIAPGCMRPSKPGYADQPCTAQTPGWPWLLEKYRKSYDVLRCPTAGDQWGIYGNPLYNWWFNWSRFSQHGYNWVYLGQTPYPATPAGIQRTFRQNLFRLPSDTIVFVDTRIYDNTLKKSTEGYIASDPPTAAHATDYGGCYWFGGWSAATSAQPSARHADGINTLMMDTHVKKFRIGFIGDDTHWDFGEF